MPYFSQKTSRPAHFGVSQRVYYINFIYPKAPSIPVSPVSDWKNILYAKFDEEISSILKSCYVEVEQIPTQIRNFLERCGYKTGDKVVIFSSLKALETLPLTDEQLQNYKNLIQNKDARKKFIHNFWHDENRVQFELDVLKQPDALAKVQATLDSFVQSLQSLAEDPYWGDYIIYPHAVLEAPATRLRKLKHLIFSFLDGSYAPYKNEVEFQLVFDAYSRYLGNTKIIALPKRTTPGASTQGILNMSVMEGGIHELKHLGDLHLGSEFLRTLLLGVDSDQTLNEIVSRLYTVQYDGTQFESYLLRNYSNAIREDAKTAQSNPNGRWPERTANEVAWRSADEFWNVMGLRSLKYLQYRVFCFNPFSDNVYYSQKSKTLRDIYPYKGAYPASINWAEPLDLNLYKGYLDGVQDLFRQLNAKT